MDVAASLGHQKPGLHPGGLKPLPLEVEDNDRLFKIVLKAGGIMDVAEAYPWHPSGEVVTHKRRDKRSGTIQGRVVSTDKGPHIQYHPPPPPFPTIGAFLLDCSHMNKSAGIAD